MKSVKQKVSIGSDQLGEEFLAQFGVVSRLNAQGVKFPVPLGEVTILVPETLADVQDLIAAQPALVIETLARQLVTDKANAHRKAFTKAGEGAVKTANRERVRRWLFGAGMQFGAEYVALPTNDAKAINAWLDAKFEEHEDEIE